MKAYWDSSALVAASANLTLRRRLRTDGGITRPHALAETFSALTGGNLTIRLDANAAAQMLQNLAQDLDFVDLTPQEMLAGFKQARKRGVRGGRVHDFMHALAAQKSAVFELLTGDENDFESLSDTLTIEQI